MNARTIDPELGISKVEKILEAFKKFGPLSMQGVCAATGYADEALRTRVAELVTSGTLRVVGGGQYSSIYALTGKDRSVATFELNQAGRVVIKKCGRTIDLEPSEARMALQFLSRTEDVWFPPEEIKP